MPQLDQLLINSVAGYDSFVNQGAPDTNYGTADTIQAWLGADSGYIFIKFDLSSIPPSANVSSATMHLYTSYEAGTPQCAIYRVASSWTETGITWNNQPGVTGSAMYSGGAAGYYKQFSLNATETKNMIQANYGMRLHMTVGETNCYYYSQEHFLQAYPCCPRIVIDYTVPSSRAIIII